jgi:hypothetical protein
MKLDSSASSSIYRGVFSKTFFALVLSLTTISAMQASAFAQQAQTASRPEAKPFTEEWVYRVQYGHKDEWWRIFKKYQIAILERQKQLRYVKEYTVWAPGLHTNEDVRWIIVWSSSAPRTMPRRASRRARLPSSFFLTRRFSNAKRTAAGS